MTLQELCKKYDVSETSIKNAFPRTQQSILKKHGIKIIKEGRGKNAIYHEEKQEIFDDKRAMSLYMEDKEKILMDNESFNNLMNWDFLVFLAIVTTPMLVFRGSYDDFLKYVEIPRTDGNRRLLKDALRQLEDKDFISYTIDKTNKDFFIAGLYKKVEDEMEIGIGMVRICKQLADKYNKRSWVPLLKTWLGVQMMMKKEQKYTIKSLSAATGLSEYQIKESNRILKNSSIYLSSRAYKNYMTCIGCVAEMNVFYSNSKRN